MASRSRSTTSGRASSPLGWGVATGFSERFVGHDGSTTTKYARASLSLHTGLAFVVVANAADLNAGATSVSGGTLGALTRPINSYDNTGRWPAPLVRRVMESLAAPTLRDVGILSAP